MHDQNKQQQQQQQQEEKQQQKSNKKRIIKQQKITMQERSEGQTEKNREAGQHQRKGIRDTRDL